VTTLLLVVLIAALVVLIGAVAAGLRVVSRRRGSAAAPSAPPTAALPPTPRAPAEVPEPPQAQAPGSTDSSAGTTTPTLERPAPVSGRMQRLRARLARSNTAVGRGLLDLLSRDQLGDSDWEGVEDLLLAADLGVAPSTELVDRLRERVKVEGGHSRE
jgi:fused signal recognition particle receptor